MARPIGKCSVTGSNIYRHRDFVDLEPGKIVHDLSGSGYEIVSFDEKAVRLKYPNGKIYEKGMKQFRNRFHNKKPYGVL